MKADFFCALSKPEYKCLDFDDASQLSLHQKQEVVQCVRKALFLLLEGIGYNHRPIPADKRMRHDLNTWVQEHLKHLFPEESRTLEAIVQLSAECGECFYEHCSHDTKLLMAIGTTILTISDDDALLSPDERTRLSSFCCNDGNSPPDVSPWTAVLTHGLQLSAEYFSSHDSLVGSLSTNSYRLFLQTCSLEYRMENELPVHLTRHVQSHASSEKCAVEAFPRYNRSTAGAPVYYICPIFKLSRTEEVSSRYWISIVSPMSDFVNHINDLFSCPKEVLSGETWNYLSLTTTAKRKAGRPSTFGSKLWTFRDSLCELLEYMQETTLAIDGGFTTCIYTYSSTSEQSDISQDDPDAKSAAECWFAFRHGYISWHLGCKRYGLDSLAFERNTFTAEELCAPTYKPLRVAYAGAAALCLFVTSTLSYSYYFI